jgi:DNA-binding NtrC family response regulator
VIHGHADARPLPALPRDPEVVEREFVIQSLLALRAEVAALRELLAPGGSSRGSRPYGQVWDPGGAVYPTGPVRVEEPESDPLALAELERRAIERALRQSRGNRRQAARALGMSERTLYRRIKQFGLGEEAAADTGLPT